MIKVVTRKLSGDVPVLDLLLQPLQDFDDQAKYGSKQLKHIGFPPPPADYVNGAAAVSETCGRVVSRVALPVAKSFEELFFGPGGNRFLCKPFGVVPSVASLS